mgnify:CR=1 FL=1
MTTTPPLDATQIQIMKLFYSFPHTEVVIGKSERDRICQEFQINRQPLDSAIHAQHPAFSAEVLKVLGNGSRLQSAVFSECAYAQTLANMFGLSEFAVCDGKINTLPKEVVDTLDPNSNFVPRYLYRNSENTRFLIQAGGPNEVDCLFIDIEKNMSINIEFKEAHAKTSEADLPAYGEDGYLIKTDSFIMKHGQFESMIDEQIDKNLNFFEEEGSNINDFSPESIATAVSENYIGAKKASVICVEDIDGKLTMIPASHAHVWPSIRGEIRPAGRNSYKVWTPVRLRQILKKYITNESLGLVSVPLSEVATSSARGGDGSVHRYKIGSLFFIYASKVELTSSAINFELKNVRQLKPTISAHMHFTKLKISDVQAFYSATISD